MEDDTDSETYQLPYQSHSIRRLDGPFEQPLEDHEDDEHENEGRKRKLIKIKVKKPINDKTPDDEISRRTTYAEQPSWRHPIKPLDDFQDAEKRKYNTATYRPSSPFSTMTTFVANKPQYEYEDKKPRFNYDEDKSKYGYDYEMGYKKAAAEPFFATTRAPFQPLRLPYEESKTYKPPKYSYKEPDYAPPKYPYKEPESKYVYEESEPKLTYKEPEAIRFSYETASPKYKPSTSFR